MLNTYLYSAAFGLTNSSFTALTAFCQAIFAVDMILRKNRYCLLMNLILDFFTEYLSEEDNFVVKDLKKIGARYLR